jgi:hypothetical protein
VAQPLDVRVDAIDAQADDLAAEVLELLVALGELDELRRADRRKVGRMREEEDPLAAVLRQAQGALGAIGGEIWCL